MFYHSFCMYSIRIFYVELFNHFKGQKAIFVFSRTKKEKNDMSKHFVTKNFAHAKETWSSITCLKRIRIDDGYNNNMTLLRPPEKTFWKNNIDMKVEEILIFVIRSKNLKSNLFLSWIKIVKLIISVDDSQFIIMKKVITHNKCKSSKVFIAADYGSLQKSHINWA